MADKRHDLYNFASIEKKWQQRWKDADLFRTENTTDKPKFYGLDFFPYPSGAGLSVGHCRNYIPTDVACRYKRMNGFNVLHPMGWDAFGLPAENEAIKKLSHPKKTVPEYIETYKRQMDLIGIGYDWSREVNSSSSDYYKWTQWIFQLLYKRGLAYRSMAPANWCPSCSTVLANEEVKDGRCWRCDSFIEKKDLPQWFFKITEYADRLIDDLEGIDWPDSIKLMQRNWIGRSEGAEVKFETEKGDTITVYTTRPDTLWGATFMVLAPEHPLVEKLTTDKKREEVEAYKKLAQRESAIERQSTEKEKTGVFTGAYAINPVNKRRVPIWIADYVMMGYGTGAIMAVPAHDERDFEFALKFGIPIIPVIDRTDGLAKSRVFEECVERGFGAALKDAGISFELRDAFYYITMHGDKQVDEYIQIARGNLKNVEAWIEVVGTVWAFIFANRGLIVFDSIEAEAQILQELLRRAPSLKGVQTVMQILAREQFYRDALFHADYGAMINSGEFSSTPGDIAKKKVTQWLADTGQGKHAVNFKLRDWLISRQRYWGAPIPIIHCPKCGEVLVPEDQLPVELPDVDNYIPSGSGKSPLANISEFVDVACPKCGGPAKRETDTMGGFACSSWYFLRFVSPKLDSAPFDKDLAAYWLPVDLYVGGAEHAVMHLLYARFWTKVLYDAGWVPFAEPFKRLMNQGMLLAMTPHRTMDVGDTIETEGEEVDHDLIPLLPEEAEQMDPEKIIWKYVKMSKSKRNVVTPDTMAEKFGADSLRTYELFVAPFEDAVQWSEDGVNGAHRFMGRIWRIVNEWTERFDADWASKAAQEAESNEKAKSLRRKTHQTIRKVGEDIEKFAFNTAVAALMELTNEMHTFNNTLGANNTLGGDLQSPPQTGSAVMSEAIENLILLISPMVPHIADELWESLGKSGFTLEAAWPSFDAEVAKEDSVEIVAQINGKVKDKMVVPADADEETLKSAALASERIQAELAGKTVRKVIVVKGKLVNIVAN
ncbi:MAG: class I tRNA ligase family protein [Armatimonadetes bacterium]|nr:class I tRNA ligase family protein [Armatimonadota bacterium]